MAASIKETCLILSLKPLLFSCISLFILVEDTSLVSLVFLVSSFHHELDVRRPHPDGLVSDIEEGTAMNCG